VIDNGAGPKDHAQDSGLKDADPSELRRPVPHGTAFRGYEWRGCVPTFKAIVVEKSDGGQKVTSPISTKPI